jgi:hypothetical protein
VLKNLTNLRPNITFLNKIIIIGAKVVPINDVKKNVLKLEFLINWKSPARGSNIFERRLYVFNIF